MMNRMTVLLTFLAAFMITSPAMAAPPEGDTAATDEKAADDAKADDAKADDAKADDAKADDAKADDAKADDAKADDAKADDAKVDDAKADDAKADDAKADDAKADDAKADDAKAEISDDKEAMSVVKSLIDAAKGGQWSLVVAFALMLLVYAANRFGLKAKLGAKAVPWVAAGTGMAGYVAAALMVDGAVLSDAVLGGLATGAAAVGLWEMLFKHFMPGKKAAVAQS